MTPGDAGLVPRLFLAAGLLAATIIGVVLIVGSAGRSASDAALDVAETSRAGSAVGALRSDVLDLETGLRGFGLTGRPEFLDPFRDARTRLRVNADKLDRAVAGAGVRVPSERLRTAIRIYLVEYAPKVVAGPRPTPGPVVAEGKRQVDGMRAILEAARAQIAVQRTEQRARVRTRAERIETVVPIGIALVALAILAAVFAAWRYVVRPLRDLAAMGPAADGTAGTERPRGGTEVAGVRRAMGAMAARLEAEEQRAAARAAVMGPFGVGLASAATVEDVRGALLSGARTAFGGHDAVLATRTPDGRYVEVVAEDGTRRWGASDELIVRALDEAAPLVARGPDGTGWEVAFALRDAGGRHALSVRLPDDESPPSVDGILVEQLGSLAAGALTRAEVADREHEISVVLQSALLPDRFPRVDGLDLAHRFRPQSTDGLVGGDVLDVQELADGRLALFVGDVSGKGAQAAGFAAVARSEVRAMAVRERDPAAALAAVDRILTVSEHRSGRHVTAALLYAEPTDQGVSVTVATAGHPPPLVLGSGRWEVLRLEPAPPLGTSLGDGRAAQRVLAPGDAIVLFTDGLTEARAPERVDRPEDLVALLAGVHQIEEALDCLMEHVAPHGGAAPRDDVAVLALAVPRVRDRSAPVA